MNNSIDPKKTLFNHIKDKKDQHMVPYILFLGAGASLNSGCPSMHKIVMETIDNYGFRDSKSIDEQELFNEFFNIIKGFEDDERHLLARRLFKDAKPSAGYQYLAQLLKWGYFDIVLTTNYDNLLEDTLNQIELFPPKDYAVMIVGKEKDKSILKQIEYTTPRIKIIKLHGDLITGEFKFTPDEIYKFSPIINECIQKILKKEVVIVGYRVQDTDVIRCLLDSEEPIWYVNPTPPEQLIRSLLAGRRLTEISGENGKFDRFFQDLYNYLSSTGPESMPPSTTDSFPYISTQLKNIIDKLQPLYKLEKLDDVYDYIHREETGKALSSENGVSAQMPISLSSDTAALQVELQQKEARLRQRKREKKLYQMNKMPCAKINRHINNLIHDIHRLKKKLNE